MKLSTLRVMKHAFVAGLPFFNLNNVSNLVSSKFSLIPKTYMHNMNTITFPVVLEPNNFYVNFELSERQTRILNEYIKSENDDFEIIPINIFEHEAYNGNDKEKQDVKILSVNVYNVHNHLHDNHLHIKEHITNFAKTKEFMKKDKHVSVENDPSLVHLPKITVCDVKTYVRNVKTGEAGTMILDFVSNVDFIDSINIFKSQRGTIDVSHDEFFSSSKIMSHRDKIDFSMKFHKKSGCEYKLSKDFICLHEKKICTEWNL